MIAGAGVRFGDRRGAICTDRGPPLALPGVSGVQEQMAAMACLAARGVLPLRRGATSGGVRHAPLAPLAALSSGRSGNVAFRSPTPGASFTATPGPGPSLLRTAAAATPPPEPAAAAAAAKPAKGPSKARLPSLDSLRFFLIAYIAVGHFVAFATKDPFLLRLLTQVNVWVGPFFVLSGYVAGYTATELAKYEASPRVKPAGAYTVARVSGYYPLFALIQVRPGLAGVWGAGRVAVVALPPTAEMRGGRRWLLAAASPSHASAHAQACQACLVRPRHLPTHLRPSCLSRHNPARRSSLAPCLPLLTTPTMAPSPPLPTSS